MPYSIAAVAVVLLIVFAGSLLVERLLGRSRKEFHRPGWFIVLYALFIPGSIAVYAFVPVDHPLMFAAYGMVGGVAALIAQCFYGVQLKARSGQEAS